MSETVYISGTELLTYQDLVERVLDTFGEFTYAAGRQLRLARRAISTAYHDLADMHDWSYYERRGQLKTVASQTTGTITFDYTGGSSERLLTLAGATFPTDARLYSVMIANVVYKIQEYLSSTTVQLTEDSNPGADVAAGTSYTLFKALYEAPTNFRNIDFLLDMARGYALQPMTPSDALGLQVGNQSPQQEIGFTVRNAGENYGGLVIELVPPPSAARTYDYMYRVSPRKLTIDKYSTGTVTSSAGSTTIEGASSPAWTDKYVGCIMRIAPTDSGSTVPTPPEGNSDGVEPYVAQRVITSVTDTDTLVVNEAFSASTTYTAVKYVISDPVDVEPNAMLSLLERMAEAEFAILTNNKNQGMWEAAARTELIRAMSADSRMKETTSLNDRSLYTLRDWAIDEAYVGSVIT